MIYNIRHTLVILICLLFVSCENKKDNVLNAFDEMHAHIVAGDADKIDESLTSTSREFIDKLTGMDDISLQNILDLGKEYRIQDVLFNYYSLYKKELDTNNTSESFYNYLSLQEAPLFDLKELYKVNEEKTRLNPDIFIAIYKTQFRKNYLNWVKLNEEDTSFKYDLMYTLELFNKKQKKINDESFKGWNKGTKFEFYDELSKLQNYNGFDHEQIKSQRNKNIITFNNRTDSTK